MFGTNCASLFSEAELGLFILDCTSSHFWVLGLALVLGFPCAPEHSRSECKLRMVCVCVFVRVCVCTRVCPSSCWLPGSNSSLVQNSRDGGCVWENRQTGLESVQIVEEGLNTHTHTCTEAYLHPLLFSVDTQPERVCFNKVPEMVVSELRSQRCSAEARTQLCVHVQFGPLLGWFTSLNNMSYSSRRVSAGAKWNVI